MRPLENVTVIELARVLAGPWCGQLLADLGATVIKVERPGMGDDTRHWGPPFVTDAAGDPIGAAYYHAANRGKTSRSIDIATPAGQAAVRRLIADADVVIENYKVGGLARYGLDYASLSAARPGLVYCSITGFGQTGPLAERAGYDFVAQGMSGFMSINGEADGPPLKAGVAYADIFTGVYSATAILAALHRRGATGKGAHIDMALLDTQIGVLANQALTWMVSGRVPGRMGNGHTNLVPYQAFPTIDGDLIIAVGNDRQFNLLCDVLDLGFASDAAYATNAARVANQGVLITAIEHRTRAWRKADLANALDAVGVPAGPINTIDEAFASAHVEARGMAISNDGVPGVASPIVIDGERMVAATGSPPLGDEDAS